jgi:hypothetical protein
LIGAGRVASCLVRKGLNREYTKAVLQFFESVSEKKNNLGKEGKWGQEKLGGYL